MHSTLCGVVSGNGRGFRQVPNGAVGALLGVADFGVGHWNSDAALSSCEKVYT